MRGLPEWGIGRCPPGNRKEVNQMSYILDFLTAVAADVSGYYVCKWIDRMRKGS